MDTLKCLLTLLMIIDDGYLKKLSNYIFLLFASTVLNSLMAAPYQHGQTKGAWAIIKMDKGGVS